MNRDTCCFTGHRDIPTKKYSEIRMRMIPEIKRLYAAGVRKFISGGAKGFDTYAAAIVLIVKRELPDIELWFAIPYEDYDKSWSETDRIRTRNMRSCANGEKVINCSFLRRDEWMVDNSNYCIAYYDGRPGGGTAKTVKYAKLQNCEVINLFEETDE